MVHNRNLFRRFNVDDQSSFIFQSTFVHYMLFHFPPDGLGAEAKSISLNIESPPPSRVPLSGDWKGPTSKPGCNGVQNYVGYRKAKDWLYHSTAKDIRSNIRRISYCCI